MRLSQKVTRLSAVVTLTLLASLTISFRNPGNAVQPKWSVYVIHTGEGEADIHFTGDIPGGWKMYSQNMTGVEGPLGTKVEFDPDPAYEIVGAAKETGKTTTYFQNDLGMEVSCLEGKAQYVQHISYKTDKAFAIKCVISYMLCRDGEMLPPDDEDFAISIMP